MTAYHLCLICLNTADQRFTLGLGLALGLGSGFVQNVQVELAF